MDKIGDKMKKTGLAIGLSVLVVGVSLFQTWRVSSELRQQKILVEQQKIQTEQQIALITLSQKVPNAVLEGFTQVDKVYVAQVNVPGSSSHLYAFIGRKWFDLGEGNMNITTDNKTGAIK